MARTLGYKPILCLDFDSTIHSYSSGWKGATHIPDPPVEGAFGFIFSALQSGWDVVIHSSRARHPLGIWAMKKWFKNHTAHYDGEMRRALKSVKFVRFKPSATITIDDRAVTFTGVWPSLDILRQFKPWNK